MDRVQLAAIVLGIVILLYWFATVPSRPPAPAPSVTESRADHPPPAAPGTPSLAPTLPDDAAPQVAPVLALTQSPWTVLENDAVRIEVSHLGGRLRSIQLKQYRASLEPDAGPVELVTVPERGTLLVFLGDGVFAQLERAEQELLRAEPREVQLRSKRDGVEVRRILTLDEQGYGARLRVRVDNNGDSPVHPAFQLVWYGQDLPAKEQQHFQRYSLVASTDADIERAPLGQGANPLACGGGGGGPKPMELAAPVDWAGIDSQYFLLGALPESPTNASVFLGPIGRQAGQSVLSYPPFEVPAGGYLERNYRIYLGPKARADVAAVDARLEPSVSVGWIWVQPLVEIFVSMLIWTYTHLVSNYGIAIILLTFLVRLGTFPLTQRSMKSMQSVQVVAPEMKALQEKYKDDRARLQQEMMAMYKRKGINPLTAMGGGCILMLIQMPFLLALYFALQSSIELRHAPFIFWIQDLSAPEDLFAIAGLPIRPLPLLMGASMVLQQRLMPTPNVDPQQRQMMMWMSVFFIFLFYSFASGLVLYWFVSNLLAIGQQMLLRRKMSSTQRE